MTADLPGGRDAASLARLRDGEVYLSVWPPSDAKPAEQLEAVYRERDRRLSDLKVPPERVLWERLFLAAPLPPDAESVLGKVRARRSGAGPACWAVLEPPCTPGRLCELQVHALSSGGDGA